MKKLTLITAILLTFYFSIPSAHCQVKMSEYQPLKFNEMLLNPRIKSRKYEENMNKLISLAKKMNAYSDVNEVDNFFDFEMKDLATKILKIAEEDLSTKDAEIQGFEFKFDKIMRDFETRERAGVTRLRLSQGSPIYSLPAHPLENPSNRLLGHSSEDNTFILEKHNTEYLKVKYKDSMGYVSVIFLK